MKPVDDRPPARRASPFGDTEVPHRHRFTGARYRCFRAIQRPGGRWLRAILAGTVSSPAETSFYVYGELAAAAPVAFLLGTRRPMQTGASP